MRTRVSGRSGDGGKQNPRTPQPRRSFPPPPRQIPAPPMRPVRQPRRLPKAK
ncbi:hypothetical protein AB0C10_02395 [Microbispora amethystogenes]|uniref:Uncharacterized protein n=1 Tax=Microbispora amethystogenes TaxID=1427754 RepID=A0ABQ4F803_9ACTN|nr:hypothetical protein [Microbispora amethystogenes]GIH30873.1 hypothetical protein Mam01_10370 [Microbispora amethystogenes]